MNIAMESIALAEHYIEFMHSASEIRLYAKIWPLRSHQHLTPIILFHDSLDSVQLWRDFSAQLAEKIQRQVIAYGRYGFGQSAVNHQPLTVSFVSDEATLGFAAVLIHLDIQDFIVMGHSIGGGMTTCCAALYAERCKALITMSAQASVEEFTLAVLGEAKQVFKQDG